MEYNIQVRPKPSRSGPGSCGGDRAGDNHHHGHGTKRNTPPPPVLVCRVQRKPVNQTVMHSDRRMNRCFLAFVFFEKPSFWVFSLTFKIDHFY